MNTSSFETEEVFNSCGEGEESVLRCREYGDCDVARGCFGRGGGERIVRDVGGDAFLYIVCGV